ncbi:ChaN family lipoprotein [Pseudochryseolinea flava]|nr:ChaN family lipoprotein [Pseudochryseolinea flava]
MNKIALLLISLVFIGAVQAQEVSQHFKIYNTKTKSIATLENIVEHAGDFDIIFFGEEHNDSIGHVMQDTLYKALLAAHKDVTLSMEMFERDCQIVVDEYVAGIITEQQLIKEGRAWKNYRDYAGPVNTARALHQKVIAANAPRRYVNLVSRKGLASLDALEKDAKQYFASLPIDTVNARYAERFKTIMGGHVPNRNMYYAQSLWDATMAESIYEAWKVNKKTKVFHLNGKFHTDERLGTVTQLERINKRVRITTISCFRADDFNSPDWTKYQHLADFIILTDPAIKATF